MSDEADKKYLVCCSGWLAEIYLWLISDDETADDADDVDGKADNMSIYTLPDLWRSATAVLYKI